MNSKLIKIASTKYGVKEIAGTKHNPEIINFAKESGFNNVVDDEMAWCSSFMNWVAFKAGAERSKRLDARSWLQVGTPVLIPEFGDVVIFKRGDSDWQGHVGLFFNQVGDLIYVLGGNQSNMVNISPYNVSALLGYRRLRKLTEL